MTILFLILLTAIINLAYLAFIGLVAYAAAWFGWQAFTKGSIPMHAVKPNKHVNK